LLIVATCFCELFQWCDKSPRRVFGTRDEIFLRDLFGEVDEDLSKRS
jgi:hypothetical protein